MSGSITFLDRLILKSEQVEQLQIQYADRKQKWWEWHKKNPHVWEYFKKYSDIARETGINKCSAWLIVNRIRWEVEIVTVGNKFKISNDYIAFYSRWYNTLYPNFFNTKPFKEERLMNEI